MTKYFEILFVLFLTLISCKQEVDSLPNIIKEQSEKQTSCEEESYLYFMTFGVTLKYCGEQLKYSKLSYEDSLCCDNDFIERERYKDSLGNLYALRAGKSEYTEDYSHYENWLKYLASSKETILEDKLVITEYGYYYMLKSVESFNDTKIYRWRSVIKNKENSFINFESISRDSTLNIESIVSTLHITSFERDDSIINKYLLESKTSR